MAARSLLKTRAPAMNDTLHRFMSRAFVFVYLVKGTFQRVIVLRRAQLRHLITRHRLRLKALVFRKRLSGLSYAPLPDAGPYEAS